MNLIIAGGGTGGHLFMGLAAAEAWNEEFAQSGGRVIFVGSANGMEKELIPPYGYELILLPASPIKGRGLVDRIKSLFQFVLAVFAAVKLVRQLKPSAVLGIGGYASGAMIVASRLCHIPIVLIDPNAWPGMTNRILGRWSDKVLLTFEKAREFFADSKVEIVGNPVLKARLPSFSKRSWPEIPTLLVCGGSQGAHHINEVVVECLGLLQEHFPFLQVIHQTGKNDFEAVSAAYQKSGVRALVAPFFDKMEEIYPRAHLAIARSGAGTCTELALWQMPSILVPYPHAADNHQWWNAKGLCDAGGAEMILDHELTPQKLADLVTGLLSDSAKLQSMASAAGSLAKPDAARRVVLEIRKIMRSNSVGR